MSEAGPTRKTVFSRLSYSDLGDLLTSGSLFIAPTLPGRLSRYP